MKTTIKPAISATPERELPMPDNYLNNNWIMFLRQYGPIPRNDNMYDESIQRAGPPRHFLLSFLGFSIVTNYRTYTLYLLSMTKATINRVKRCEYMPQRFSFPPNAELAIRPSPPILMRWP